MSLMTCTRLAAGTLAGAVVALLATGVHAGPGHDHGPASPAITGPSSPRVVAVSEIHELVGILSDGKLLVYLDRLADTSPVTGAKVDLLIDNEAAVFEGELDGRYDFSSPLLAQHGDREIVVTIEDGGRSDLLIGTLREDHRGEGEHGGHSGHDHGADTTKEHAGDGHEKLPAVVGQVVSQLGFDPSDVERRLANAPLLGGIGLAFGVMAGALLRGRTAVMLGVAGLVVVVGAGAAWAGPGHDHGEGGSATGLGDAPRRLPDGELFLPKPTQRLLAIRTRVLEPETAHSAVRLIGRIIADPNRSGLVQSTIGGRVVTVADGLPALGQRVRKGQELALVEPAFAPIDASDVRQTAGDLAQRIAVLDARIARQRRLVDRGVVNAASLEDLEIEREGLDARRRQLVTSRSEPEALIAPVDGVIAEVRIVAGQVVTSADTLFNIIDPQSLWVEAISFDPRIDPASSRSRARTSDGELFDLSFVGRSRALQQQATVLQFRVMSPSEVLSIGSPVKVLIEKSEAVRGLIVPRSAIAQAPNGQMVAFKRLEPERYLPVAVRITDLDGERVQVTAGLKPGDQIIVRGAPLVNQIR